MPLSDGQNPNLLLNMSASWWLCLVHRNLRRKWPPPGPPKGSGSGHGGRALWVYFYVQVNLAYLSNSGHGQVPQVHPMEIYKLTASSGRSSCRSAVSRLNHQAREPCDAEKFEQSQRRNRRLPPAR